MKNEEEIYQVLKMDYIPPEMREDRGEIEAAQDCRLPSLVKPSQIRGDLHIHSNWSDGGHSIEELARVAQEKGYEYIAITDHSQSLGIAGGLKEEKLLRQIEHIRRMNKKLKNFRILTGTEVDIKSDGRLDYKDKILARLDIVIAAIHTGFKQDRERLTQRIMKAMENKYVHIIAHPTARLMGTRPPYDIDINEVLKTAHRTNTSLEINAYAERLDLNDINSRRAKEMGVSLAIGTDTHYLAQLESMHLGVAVARRAWCEKKDILNILTLDKLLKKIESRVRS